MRQWFTMKAEGEDVEIAIYDEIGKSFWGDDTVSAKSFLDQLESFGDVKNITLRINSPGGDVFDGVAIHNAIKNHKAKVTARVDGIAASIASYIAMAADKIVMPSNAFMLIHNASGFAMGNAEDMHAMGSDLERIDKSIVATYASRSGTSGAKIKSIMKEDRLMDAAEAKELGLADSVEKEQKLAANFSLRLLPKAAAERFRAETGTVQGDPPHSVLEPEGTGEQPVASPDPPAQPKKEPGQQEPKLPPDPFKTPGYQEHPGQPPQEQPPVTRPSEPAPAPTPGTPRSEKVIDLKAAKQEGIDEHRAYVQAITDLCALARAPERVGNYVRGNVSVDQVRKELWR